MQRKVITISVVAGVLALVAGGLCLAQPPQGGDQGGPGGPGGFDPAQMRQRMMDNWKQQLGADDDAWKVIEPRLTKVMELSRQSMSGGRGMFGMFGMRGMRGGQRGDRGGQQGQGPGGQQGDRPRFPGEENREPTAVEKAQETLSTTLENESASADTIKEQLTALRAARVKAQQELAVAQRDLQQILTMRQEAVLVLSGMLN